MVWLYKLKNLTVLNQASIALLSLNLIVFLFVFFAESPHSDVSADYPTLELFSSTYSLHSNRAENVIKRKTPVLVELDLTSFNGHKEDVVERVSPSKPEGEKLTQLEHRKERDMPIDKVASRICYEIGPVTSNSERMKLQDMIEMKGVFVSVKYNQSHEDLGYWVFIPSLRSRALGRLKVEELRFKGFREVMLLRRNEPINAISLGVFETQKEAHKLLLKAQSFGFNAKMDVRSQGIDNIWLVAEVDFQRNPNEESWLSLLKGYPQIKKQRINCS